MGLTCKNLPICPPLDFADLQDIFLVVAAVRDSVPQHRSVGGSEPAEQSRLDCRPPRGAGSGDVFAATSERVSLE